MASVEHPLPGNANPQVSISDVIHIAGIPFQGPMVRYRFANEAAAFFGRLRRCAAALGGRGVVEEANVDVVETVLIGTLRIAID